MKFDILSLFPEYFRGPFDESMIKRAVKKGILELRHVNIRDFTTDKHKTVDDRPYGGGPGMVLMAEPVAKAIRSVKTEESKVIYLSPQGRKLDAALCRELAKNRHLILLCGHYEGVDERVIESDVDEQVSIGDYVLTNGALAAIVLVDAVARFIPGVVGDENGVNEDSFENGILDWPHFTRPEIFEGKEVPRILLSGDHKKIAKWRHEKARERTRKMRPDLFDEENLV